MNTRHLAASAFALGARQARGNEAWDPRLPAITFGQLDLDDTDQLLLLTICQEGFAWSTEQTAIGRPIRPSYSALQALEDHPHLAQAMPAPAVQLDLDLPAANPLGAPIRHTQTAASNPCLPKSVPCAWSGSRPSPAPTAPTHPAGAIAQPALIKTAMNERSATHGC